MSKRVRRVEYDPPWGWVARKRDGTEIGPGGEQGFRWTSRSVARCVVQEHDLLEADRNKRKRKTKRALAREGGER